MVGSKHRLNTEAMCFEICCSHADSYLEVDFIWQIRSYILAIILEEDVSKWFFPVPLPMIQFVFNGLINYSSLHIVYAAEFDLTMSRKTN